MNSDPMTISLSWNVVWGLLLVGLGSYWGRLSRDNRVKWARLHGVTPRSFENTAPPLDRVSVGCWGLIAGNFYRLLSISAFILAADLIVFGGELVLVRRDLIFQQIGDVLGEILRIFIMLLRAILAGAEQ